MAEWLTRLPLDQKDHGSIPILGEQDGRVVKVSAPRSEGPTLSLAATPCAAVIVVAQTIIYTIIYTSS